MIRDFLYLDAPLVAQSLSQLDFGIFKEWEETLARVAGSDGGTGLTLWGALDIHGGRTKSHTTGNSAVFEQTAESYAARLLMRLEQLGQVIKADARASQEVRRGNVLIASGTVRQFANLDVVDSEWPIDVQVKIGEIDEKAAVIEIPGTLTKRIKAIGLVALHQLTVLAPWIVEHFRVDPGDVFSEQVEMLCIVRHAYRLNDGTMLAVVRTIAIY